MFKSEPNPVAVPLGFLLFVAFSWLMALLNGTAGKNVFPCP